MGRSTKGCGICPWRFATRFVLLVTDLQPPRTYRPDRYTTRPWRWRGCWLPSAPGDSFACTFDKPPNRREPILSLSCSESSHYRQSFPRSDPAEACHRGSLKIAFQPHRQRSKNPRLCPFYAMVVSVLSIEKNTDLSCVGGPFVTDKTNASPPVGF